MGNAVGGEAEVNGLVARWTTPSLSYKPEKVTADGGIVLRSPNGTRYKITVDNNGNLTTTAV